MARNYACQQTGKMAFVWKDGLFSSVYCVCGIKITIDDDYPRTGIKNQYVLIPKHNTRSLKRK